MFSYKEPVNITKRDKMIINQEAIDRLKELSVKSKKAGFEMATCVIDDKIAFNFKNENIVIKGEPFKIEEKLVIPDGSEVSKSFEQTKKEYNQQNEIKKKQQAVLNAGKALTTEKVEAIEKETKETFIAIQSLSNILSSGAIATPGHGKLEK